MLVTTWKYIPFDAGKTVHLDRLCLENFFRECRANFGRRFSVFFCLFFVNNSIEVKKTQTFITFVTKDCSKKTEIAMIAMFLFFVHYFRQITNTKKIDLVHAIW